MLSRSRSRAGWLACVPQDGCLRLALVEAGERPTVSWLHTEATGSSTAASLHRAHRAAPRGHWLSVALLERAQYQILQAEAPDMPPAEWRDALRWRLKDHFDFAADTAAVDYLPLPAQAGARQQHGLIAVVAPGAARDQLRRDGQDAGWNWQAIDIPEAALRHLGELFATPGRGHALLHLGPTVASLVITLNGALLLTRQIDVNRDHLASTDESVRQAAQERAGLELQRTLDGFDRVFSQVGLERLDILPGPGAESFADFARELVYVPVKLADVAAALALPDQADPSEHWIAIGAALRHASDNGDDHAVKELNLDPPSLVPPPKAWRAAQGLWAAAGALAAAWLLSVGLGAWANQRQHRADEMAQSLPRQRAELEARDPGGADAIQRLAAERDRLQRLDADQRRLRAEIDDHMRRATEGYTPYFSALSRQAQDRLWITGFAVNGSGGPIEIQGAMTDANALPGYLQRLNQEPAFKGRQFARLQIAQGEGRTEFTLAGELASGVH